jgi:2-haloacid dehalogenase/putative hydrolase of the HAD superfamily
MTIKAVFLDFYGTLVHEDDDIIPLICEEVRVNADVECSIEEIGRFWWKTFSQMFQGSSGHSFQTQRELGLKSLIETIRTFQSECEASKIIQMQFDHWRKPNIFADTHAFLESVRQEQPIYILSNIDSDDIRAAMEHHGICADGVITSEDVRSYKPRPELFQEALRRYNLQPDEVIHIGDSIVSDVYGAQEAGIDAVWLNRKGKTKPVDIEPKYVCKDLDEVKVILKQ